MLRLMILKFYILNKNIWKLYLTYITVFVITLSFSLLLIMIWDNNVGHYKDSSYNYFITNFVERNIEELEENQYVDEIYTSRIIMAPVESKNQNVQMDIYVVDHWDNSGISYLGANRKVAGHLESERENGIIVDILTARSLHVGVGDTIYIDIGESKVAFNIIMLIEPVRESSQGTGVCLYNSYFKEQWNKYFKEEPCYSIMFVNGNNEKELDDYFYNDYIAPGMDNESLDNIKEANRTCIIKKEWSIQDVEEEMEYTPPITICVSILGMVLTLFFIWRESSSKSYFLVKNMAVLSTVGMRKIYIVLYIFIGQSIVLLPSICVAALIVKKVVYDILISNYYLSWNLVGGSTIIVAGISMISSLMVGIGLSVKFRKSSICKLLSNE